MYLCSSTGTYDAIIFTIGGTGLDIDIIYIFPAPFYLITTYHITSAQFSRIMPLRTVEPDLERLPVSCVALFAYVNHRTKVCNHLGTSDRQPYEYQVHQAHSTNLQA